MDKKSLFFIISVSLSLLIINMFFNYQHEEKLRQWREKKERKKEQYQGEAFREETNDVSIRKNEEDPLTDQKSQEKYFVLENAYQQLVFSNYGGALVEINLPFSSEKNASSIVKEIEFDRMIEKKHTKNAYFPLYNHYIPGDSPKGPFVEKKERNLGGYYPLLRRNFFDPIKQTTIRNHPSAYAFNIVSDFPEVAELVYDVKQFEKNRIVFEAIQQHRRITKTFSILETDRNAPYCIDVSIKVEKNRRDNRQLWITTGVPEVELMSGTPSPILHYRITRLGKSEVEKINLPSDKIKVSSVKPDWICNSNGFLGFIIDPLGTASEGYQVQFTPGTTLPSRLASLEGSRFKSADLPGYNMMLPLNQDGTTTKFRFFAGPFAESILKTLDKTFADPSIGYSPDYISCQSFHGWFSFISEPFAKFLLILMNFFHKMTNSWAFSIVLLTASLRLMLYPLNAWSLRSMRRAQKLQPKIAAIQEKHKKDPQKAQLEIMNLYRKSGANPLVGCFPMLIQMPFLIGMFDLLKSTFELRGATFVPGWIDNLTAPDVLFDWGTPVFFIGSQLHILPLALGGLMFLQQKMSTDLPKDKNVWTDQDRQKAMMGTMMPLVFTFLFYNFPSGLNIYWISSTLLGLLQQMFTNRQIDKEPNKVEEPLKERKKRK